MTTSGNDDTATDQGSSRKSSPSLVEKFVIRLPSGLRNKIKQLSEQNRRSMNAEIIMVLEKHIQQNLLQELQDMQDSDEDDEYKRRQLQEKLEALPPEKKEALLELLG